jgi:hypothetical protein
VDEHEHQGLQLAWVRRRTWTCFYDIEGILDEKKVVEPWRRLLGNFKDTEKHFFDVYEP